MQPLAQREELSAFGQSSAQLRVEVVEELVRHTWQRIQVQTVTAAEQWRATATPPAAARPAATVATLLVVR